MTMLTVANQPINKLTVAELEMLITDIVRRVVREEIFRVPPRANGGTLSTAFLATFGAWEDDRAVDDIVNDVYESRTLSTTELSL